MTKDVWVLATVTKTPSVTHNRSPASSSDQHRFETNLAAFMTALRGAPDLVASGRRARSPAPPRKRRRGRGHRGSPSVPGPMHRGQGGGVPHGLGQLRET